MSVEEEAVVTFDCDEDDHVQRQQREVVEEGEEDDEGKRDDGEVEEKEERGGGELREAAFRVAATAFILGSFVRFHLFFCQIYIRFDWYILSNL